MPSVVAVSALLLFPLFIPFVISVTFLPFSLFGSFGKECGSLLSRFSDVTSLVGQDLVNDIVEGYLAFW